MYVYIYMHKGVLKENGSPLSWVPHLSATPIQGFFDGIPTNRNSDTLRV